MRVRVRSSDLSPVVLRSPSCCQGRCSIIPPPSRFSQTNALPQNLGLGVFSHRAPPNRTSTSKSKRRASTSTPPTAIFGPSSTSSDSDCDGRASENVDYSDEDDTTTSGSDSDSDEEALVPIDIDEKTLGDRQGVGRNMPSILVLASEDQADTGG